MTNNNRARHAGKANLSWTMWLIAAISLSLIPVACSTRRLAAVPSPMVARARPPVDNVRFVLGLNFDKFEDEYLLSLQRETTYLASMGHKGPLPATSYLAISGGGGNGAFGAGLITGWTGSGRPVFKTVTGISTGALIAPFAFLGPKYYPPRFHLREIAAANGYDRKRTLYTIRNDRLDPEWANVNRRTLSIASKAVSSLIHTQGNGDLHRMYLTAERDHLDYNLAYIPADFIAVRKSEFDPIYMTQLFARGQEMAAKGYPWQKYPPGYAPNPVAK
ncbi:patatin-like phospholipase family protein [Edaphobacter modestus]|uniref:Patatin-like phospholipase n=1 Tax=Edaphobacter modestus TaxID=388466 RepID=A0A4Q7Y106_9BACT|nr:patatin-like phospholipase family protein [Edaphobacter modestus]RZU29701.1 patatin-like phospholipase [Edaphobacter modestus]